MDALAGWNNRTAKRMVGRSHHPAALQTIYLSRHPSPAYLIQRWNLMFWRKKLYDSRIRYDTPAMTIISLPFEIPRYDFKAVPGKRAFSVIFSAMEKPSCM